MPPLVDEIHGCWLICPSDPIWFQEFWELTSPEVADDLLNNFGGPGAYFDSIIHNWRQYDFLRNLNGGMSKDRGLPTPYHDSWYVNQRIAVYCSGTPQPLYGIHPISCSFRRWRYDAWMALFVYVNDYPIEFSARNYGICGYSNDYKFAPSSSHYLNEIRWVLNPARRVGGGGLFYQANWWVFLFPDHDVFPGLPGKLRYITFPHLQYCQDGYGRVYS